MQLDKPSLDVLDVDGAVREMEAAVVGDTRGDLFRKAAIGGGSLIAGSTLLAGLPALADAAPSRRQDVAILNYALTLEYLEAAFYNQAVANNTPKGDLLRLTRVVQAHENTHVRALRKALGRAAVASPRFDFKDTVTDPAKFLATAIVLEDTGVAAYAGQGPRIFQTAVVKIALSIHSVEARHAAAFRAQANTTEAPRAFDRALSMRAVLKAVGDTGFIVT